MGELIRELHQGQRPCEPHDKAEHMAAPDQSVKRPKPSCHAGAVHTQLSAKFLLSWVDSNLKCECCYKYKDHIRTEAA